MHIFSEFERMISPRNRGLEIRQHGFHPDERRVGHSLPAQDDRDRLMALDFSGDLSEAM